MVMTRMTSNADGETTMSHEDDAAMSVAGCHNVTMMTASMHGHWVMTRRSAGGGDNGDDDEDKRVMLRVRKQRHTRTMV